MDASADTHARQLLVLGVALFLLGLLQGTVVQQFHSPRLALSAHIAAVQNGMVLLLFGLLWSRLALTASLERLARVASIVGMYSIWFGFSLAAVTGASRVLAFAGAGFAASAPAERGVAALIYAGAAAAIVSAALVLLGLVRRRSDA